jgi:hypothetical protein
MRQLHALGRRAFHLYLLLPKLSDLRVVYQMYDDGYKNIVNVDVRAPVLISLTGRTLADDWPGTSSIRPS